MSIYHLQSAEYGAANIIPAAGLFLGSFTNAKLIKRFSLINLIKAGGIIVLLGAMLLFFAIKLHYSEISAIFATTMIAYFGAAFIVANASSLVMSDVHDKAHGSAVMSFLNMGTATIVVLVLSQCQTTAILLPTVYLGLGAAMMVLTYL